jgi:hypothetical protein
VQHNVARVSRAQPGQRPSGAVGTITVEGPNNKSVKVKVKDPAVLQQVKPGEQVELLIAQAFAFAVEAQRR